MGREKSIGLFLMDETRAKNKNTVIINSNGGQPKTWLMNYVHYR